MKVKCFVIAMVIITITVVKVNAKEPPAGEKPQPVCAKTNSEGGSSSSVLTSIEENTESNEQEIQYFKSTCNDSDSTKHNIQTNCAIDTATFNGLKKYFKSIQPIIRKLDLQDVEKVEIL